MAVFSSLGKGIFYLRPVLVGKFLLTHFYIVILLLFTLPTIITSIQVAIDTNNPIHPFSELGLSITNADHRNYELAKQYSEDPTQILGEKPKKWMDYFGYFWEWTKFFWQITGNLFQQLFPFIFLYKWVIKPRQESETMNNLTKTFIYGFIFILIINMGLLIFDLIGGQVQLSLSEMPTEQKFLALFIYLFPFKGLISIIGILLGVPVPFI